MLSPKGQVTGSNPVGIAKNTMNTMLCNIGISNMSRIFLEDFCDLPFSPAILEDYTEPALRYLS